MPTRLLTPRRTWAEDRNAGGTDLVVHEGVLSRSVLLLLPIACSWACGGESTATTSLTARGDEREALCPTTSTETARKGGDPLWLRSYDASLVSSVASSDGDVLLARSGLETLKLDSEGQLLWSQPFGSLVASAGDGGAWVVSGSDLFKLDAAGQLVLSTSLSGESATSLAVDFAGNIALSGPDLGTVKLDTSGKLVWSKPFFGAVAFDALGNLVLTGALTASIDFGAGPIVSRGGSDVFVAKLGAGGEHLFSRAFGDQGASQRGESIVVDAQGNLLIAGVFDGSLDFGIGAPLGLATCPADAWCNTSGFAAKLDADGNALWSRALGPMRKLDGIASDSRGGIVLSGALPGGVTPFRTAWLTALDANGSALWRRAEWPETGIGAGHGVAVDACDNVFWSVSALPDLESEERAYVAKLSP